MLRLSEAGGASWDLSSLSSQADPQAACGAEDRAGVDRRTRRTWGGLWELLTEARVEHEAARVLARVFRVGVLDLASPKLAPKERVAVQDAFVCYVIEARRASDYDHLLLSEEDAYE
jgi:hypothetical protein